MSNSFPASTSILDRISSPGPTPGVSAGGREFDVVVLGAGLNSLNVSIAFHEAYGMRSLTVMRTPVAMNEKTVTSAHLTLGAQASDEDMRDALVDLARERTAARSAQGLPARPALLLTNADSLIDFLNRHRTSLGEHYLMAQVTNEQLERLADKAEFQEVCNELGIATIPTRVLDFGAQGVSSAELRAPLPWAYPVVAKAANTAEYARVNFPGKRKVFFLESEADYLSLVDALSNAGFTGRFLVQELVPGDDTAQRSITAYRATNGQVTLTCAAQVLLGEHTPDALGRPAAMVTGPHPEILAEATRFLDHVDYVGFANFDLKVDPRSGREYFLELNPRLGRNNYYVTAAGGRYPEHIVADLVDQTPLSPREVTAEALYSILPLFLVKKYVLAAPLRAAITRAKKRGVANPFMYAPEKPWMKMYGVVSGLNFVRKFRKVYPKPTATGF